jgi:hypothetical protein
MIRKSKRESYKQRNLYVEIDKDARASSKPSAKVQGAKADI